MLTSPKAMYDPHLVSRTLRVVPFMPSIFWKFPGEDADIWHEQEIKPWGLSVTLTLSEV